MLRLALIVLATSLSACGSSGVVNLDLMSQPIPPKEARLVITRSSDPLYLGAGANVRINGIKEGTLTRGGTLIKNVPAGRTTLSADATSGPGNFVFTFDTTPGKTYNVEVSPRRDSFGQSALWGLAGDAIQAQLKENTGYFQAELKGIR